METTAPNRGKPAPYGRACVNCSRAKRKCILRNSGSGCFRLKEECNASPTVRKRRSRPNPSQAARLERKLDGLVSLLKAHHGNLEPGETASSEPSPSSTRPCTSSPVDHDDQTPPHDAHRVPTNQEKTPFYQHPPKESSSSKSSGRFPYSLPEGAVPSPHEAEQYFQIFHNDYLRFFPIVHLEEGINSERLSEILPFLWICIMAVSSTNVTQQTSLGRTVREIAAREVVVEGKRTADLLLGLLCFIGWGYFRFSMGPLLTVFSHLCTALTIDLELQSRRPGDNSTDHVLSRSIAAQIEGVAKNLQPRSLEHSRTALACYFLTSCGATFQSRAESLTWSPYFEDCLRTIHNNTQGDQGNDLLVYMIKLQRITSKATGVRIQMRDADSEQSTRLIPPYISSLNAQLADVRSMFPPHLATNKALQTMALYTEICINDLVTIRLRHAPLLADPDTGNMEALFTCLTAAKASVEILFEYVPTSYASFPFFLWKQFRTAILTLIRLVYLEDPAWDVNLVRRTVDLPSILERIAENLSNLQNTSDCRSNEQEDVFSKSLGWVNVTRSWLLSAYERSPEGQAVPSHQSESIMTLVGEELLPEQAVRDLTQQIQASGMDIFSSLDQDLFGGDFFDWWPPLYSENALLHSNVQTLEF
ncbi:hypothetical protein FE257_007271 [Aspergillus nanangensis]|uniref:Zn(2)-C6 fungal-type domain-containing protein n=1 Tax=Aspergillus nanangensis TaxID=2582783 RepID=A0AAD4CN74_ASPNN|nr:hypothetical protein FE257_007271 [Aspergillus nanangensis]